MARSSQRPARGEFIVELPVVLLVLFLLLMVPMIDLVTVTYRAYLVRTSALEALHRACRADSFITDLPPFDNLPMSPSAQTVFKNCLNTAMQQNVLGAGQLKMSDPPLICVAQPIGGGTEKVFSSKLAPGTVDTQKFTYFYELRAEAEVWPILPLVSTFMPSIPGISAPMTVAVSGRQMVEKPAGLTF